MQTIASFEVNHLNLPAGVYLSRTDKINDELIYTYDLRFTSPNHEEVLPTDATHSIEHTAATYLRNHPTYKNDIIYFGPMGCRTGFYAIFTEKVKGQVLLDLLKETFEYIANFDGSVPGATAERCGNYIDHSVEGANKASAKYLEVLNNWTDLTFSYPESL